MKNGYHDDINNKNNSINHNRDNANIADNNDDEMGLQSDMVWYGLKCYEMR